MRKPRLKICKQMILDEQAGKGNSASAINEYLNAEQELISMKRRITDEHSSKRRVLEQERRSAASQLDMAKNAQATAAKVAANAWVQLGDAQEQLENARNEYRAIYGRKYVPSPRPNHCPTCGQPITDEHWEKTLKAEQEAFEAKKKADQEAVSAKGKECRGKYEEATTAADKAKEALEESDKAVAEATDYFNLTSDRLSAFPASPSFDDPALAELEAKIADLKVKKDAAPDEHVAALRKQIEDLTARNEKAKATLAKKEHKEECQKQIDELKGEQERLGQKKAEIEDMIYTIERFIMDRCRMLESSINDKFPTVRWKLFDQQINGALSDCCECMIPNEDSLMSYSGTNTAAKVNADIEIIGVLSNQAQLKP